MFCNINSAWQRLPHCGLVTPYGSPLAQVMACCLAAPSHYLNQCWLIISEDQCQSHWGQFQKKYLSHQSQTLVSKLLHFIQIPQGPIELTAISQVTFFRTPSVWLASLSSTGGRNLKRTFCSCSSVSAEPTRRKTRSSNTVWKKKI